MNSLEELKRWINEDLKLLWYEHQQIIAKIEELEKEELIQSRWESIFNDRD